MMPNSISNLPNNAALDNASSTHHSTTAALREKAFQSALVALEQAKQRHVQVRQHRAINRLSLSAYLIVQVFALPLIFCGALVWFKPQLLVFWRACILFWANLLHIPLVASAMGDTLGTLDSAATVADSANSALQLGLVWGVSEGVGGLASDLPSANIWLFTAAAVLLAYVISLRMNGDLLPIKYILRILCAVQTLALAFFFIWPTWFPYTIANHLLDMVSMGYVLLIASPLMLAMGYYILNIHLRSKIFHTVLILTYFILLVPHQVVLHLLVLQHFSLLYMPVLYICFGAVFNVLIFVALYSWAASNVPASATR